MSPAPSSSIRLLAHYLRPQWPLALGLAGLVFLGIALQLINPQILRYFIDTGLAGGAEAALWQAAGLFIAVAFGYQALGVLADYAADNVAWTATNSLRRDLTLHCLRLDLPFHKAHTPGELIERIDGDVTALSSLFSRFALHTAGNALLVIGILLVLAREDAGVGLGLTLYALAALGALFVVQRFAVRRWMDYREARADQFGFLEERIAGAGDIRGVGAAPHVLRQLTRRMRASLRAGRAALVTRALVHSVSDLIFVVGYAIGLALAIYLFTQAQASLGTAYLVVAYFGMLSRPLGNLRQQAQDVQQAAASLARIRQLLSLTPMVADRPGLQPAARAGDPPSLEFRNVSFAYDGDGHVLRDVSFSLAPGQVLGVLGRTGSGKTTLTRLLFRLYDVAEGSIYLDGRELRDLPLAELRARVALVTQEVQLFRAPLRDNLTFFDRRFDDATIERALRALGVWDRLAGETGGLDAPLGATGQGLSAGEAQLVAFARVFLKQPGLVVLDEASSRLDPATEHRLERAVDHLLEGRTAVIIAHRLQTIQRADAILILDEGRVVEFGPRAALAADPTSRLHALLQTGLMEVLA